MAFHPGDSTLCRDHNLLSLASYNRYVRYSDNLAMARNFTASTKYWF